MKPVSTLFLKAVVVLLGLAAIAAAITIGYAINSDQTGLYRPILLGMYIPAVPFFIALFQAMKLLKYIDRGTAFSDLSVNALKIIKYCGLSISALYTFGMPLIFNAADKDDAPGVVLIGLIIIFASLVIAIFAAVLQKLLRQALDIKAENDLTI